MAESGPQVNGGSDREFIILQREVQELSGKISEALGKLDGIASVGASLNTKVAVLEARAQALQSVVDVLSKRFDDSDRARAAERWGLLLAIMGALAALGVALLK